MKKFLLLLLISLGSLPIFAQQNEEATFGSSFYNKIFDEDYVERKPVFRYTKDSLMNFYLANFNGYDTLLNKAIDNGDTAKYIRVHFEYVIDVNGVPYQPKFKYVGSTKYSSGSGDKKLKYFDASKDFFNKAIKDMLLHLPSWRPALQNNKIVDCRHEDYFQLWVGINPPSN
jgi:hypothetical protein